jgi:hypothetical protein
MEEFLIIEKKGQKGCSKLALMERLMSFGRRKR